MEFYFQDAAVAVGNFLELVETAGQVLLAEHCHLEVAFLVVAGAVALA